MKPILFCLSLILPISSIFAIGQEAVVASDEKLPEVLNAYFNYLNQYPKILSFLGNAHQGEIEIILDKQKIFDIQQKTARKVGVVAEDNYWLWINDAVKFPNGTYGVYGRLLWRQSLTGATGVAVMAVLPNGKIALNRNFRHATRSWEYELPRGAVNNGETIEEAAAREVKEETGMIIDQLQLLGQIAIDSGVTNAVVPVFFAKIVAQQKAQPETSEAIASIDFFSVEELKKGFIDGFLSARINGEEICKIPLRDSFLAFALFQVDLRNL
jgi:ADP-ribose pyrophosphatase